MRLFAIAALLTASAVLPVLAQDDYKSLPAGPGRDVTVKVCSQCHSPELVSNQRLDHAGWKDLVAQMANNGAQATDAEFAQVTDYLATSFPAAGAAPGAAAPAPAAGTSPANPPANAPTAPAPAQ